MDTVIPSIFIGIFDSLLFEEIILYFFIGIAGATIANTTGAGGGIIFIPFFTLIGLPHVSSVATSIGIQCIGMSAGSISWIKHQKGSRLNLIGTALSCSLFAFIGMAIAKLAEETVDGHLNLLFGFLSINVAIVSRVLMGGDKFKSLSGAINYRFNYLLFIASLIGGIFTYYVSIGVGELVLIASVLSGYCLTRSIALAVITTSFTVVPNLFIFSFNENVIPEILLPVGAGALLGGILSSHIVSAIGVKRVKSLCIFVIGGTGLIEISIWIIT